MKNILLLLVTLLISSLTFADDFAQHSVPLQKMTCKKLDFNSYFKAQTGKTNILSFKPDLTQPNFAGKFLLLKNEMLFETLWLIANCETGQFLHESLTGTVEFKPDSTLAIVTSKSKNSPEIEYQLWTGEKWLKTDKPVEVAATSASTKTSSNASSGVTAPSVPTQYDSLFSKHSVSIDSKLTCAPLDYHSFHKAQSGEQNIKKYNPFVIVPNFKPNFAGKYVLVKNELLFETQWLIADCATGKFFPEAFTGQAQFKPESSLVNRNNSGKFPELTVWTDHQWVKIPDPIQNKDQKIENSLHQEPAKTLYKALPNAHHHSIVRFENFECTALSEAALRFERCTVEVDREKAKEVAPEHLQALKSVFKQWGYNKIKSGHCSVEKIDPVCEIEL